MQWLCDLFLELFAILYLVPGAGGPALQHTQLFFFFLGRAVLSTFNAAAAMQMGLGENSSWPFKL